MILYTTGRVSVQNLKDLHTQLGEPITDEEADEAMEMLAQYDVNPEGGFTFDTFVKLWTETHDPGKFI